MKTHDFHQHAETVTLLMSEVKKLGCKRWVKRFCRLLHIPRRDAFVLLRGVRQ